MTKGKCTAIVLAGGQGKRMGTAVQKQYLELCGKPVLFYALHTFEQSEVIDDIVLVVGESQENYCKQEIIEKYEFAKVKKIVVGGAERYHSVWNGLKEVADGYVFIHDGARPFVTEDMIARAYAEVQKHGACVVGMPVKDTIKIADEECFSKETPNRKDVWMIQTPQVFETDLVKRAYELLMQQEETTVTDDAMVVETMLGKKVKFVLGSYENIKITTPEDLKVAEAFADPPKSAKKVLDNEGLL